MGHSFVLFPISGIVTWGVFTFVMSCIIKHLSYLHYRYWLLVCPFLYSALNSDPWRYAGEVTALFMAQFLFSTMYFQERFLIIHYCDEFRRAVYYEIKKMPFVYDMDYLTNVPPYSILLNHLGEALSIHANRVPES